jgi:hypothetical protein
MAWHFMALAALLVQAHPETAVLHVNIFDLHRERRADAREGIDHLADQCPVAQTRLRGHIDAVEQYARLRDIEHRRLADFDDMLRPAHARRRIGRHDLPVTSQSNSMRIAASFCLAVGALWLRVTASIYMPTCSGSTSRIDVRRTGGRSPTFLNCHRAEDWKLNAFPVIRACGVCGNR